MKDMVPMLSIKFMTLAIVTFNPNSCLRLFFHTQNPPNQRITSLWVLEDILEDLLQVIPGVLYRNLNTVILSIKTWGDYYVFYGFPHGRILTLFMRYLGNLNIANSHTQR